MPRLEDSNSLKMLKPDGNHATYFDELVVENRSHEKIINVDSQNKVGYYTKIIWFNVILISVIHALALYSIYLGIMKRRVAIFIFGYLYGIIGGIGITAGAHRLWSHRAYKAKLPLRILLMLMNASAAQTPIHDWVRDHRVHHKYTDTDADPHNSRRGFFFSHVGWLMMKKHPEVTRRGKGVDMSDIINDPVVAFQAKYYYVLALTLGFVIPFLVPMYLWGEEFQMAFFGMFWKYTLGLNFTWFVNSAAHMWGFRPYDKDISPSENLGVSLLALGEGWHNYHHVYPWDYKAAELGQYSVNVSTAFIDFFAWLGLAYDLKSATPDMVRKQVARKGDGHWTDTTITKDSHKNSSSNNGMIIDY